MSTEHHGLVQSQLWQDLATLVSLHTSEFIYYVEQKIIRTTKAESSSLDCLLLFANMDAVSRYLNVGSITIIDFASSEPENIYFRYCPSLECSS